MERAIFCAAVGGALAVWGVKLVHGVSKCDLPHIREYAQCLRRHQTRLGEMAFGAKSRRVSDCYADKDVADFLTHALGAAFAMVSSTLPVENTGVAVRSWRCSSSDCDSSPNMSSPCPTVRCRRQGWANAEDIHRRNLHALQSCLLSSRRWAFVGYLRIDPACLVGAPVRSLVVCFCLLVSNSRIGFGVR